MITNTLDDREITPTYNEVIISSPETQYADSETIDKIYLAVKELFTAPFPANRLFTHPLAKPSSLSNHCSNSSFCPTRDANLPINEYINSKIQIFARGLNSVFVKLVDSCKIGVLNSHIWTTLSPGSFIVLSGLLVKKSSPCTKPISWKDHKPEQVPVNVDVSFISVEEASSLSKNAYSSKDSLNSSFPYHNTKTFDVNDYAISMFQYFWTQNLDPETILAIRINLTNQFCFAETHVRDTIAKCLYEDPFEGDAS